MNHSCISNLCGCLFSTQSENKSDQRENLIKSEIMERENLPPLSVESFAPPKTANVRNKEPEIGGEIKLFKNDMGCYTHFEKNGKTVKIKSYLMIDSNTMFVVTLPKGNGTFIIPLDKSICVRTTCFPGRS